MKIEEQYLNLLGKRSTQTYLTSKKEHFFYFNFFETESENTHSFFGNILIVPLIQENRSKEENLKRAENIIKYLTYSTYECLIKKTKDEKQYFLFAYNFRNQDTHYGHESLITNLEERALKIFNIHKPPYYIFIRNSKKKICLSEINTKDNTIKYEKTKEFEPISLKTLIPILEEKENKKIEFDNKGRKENVLFFDSFYLHYWRNKFIKPNAWKKENIEKFNKNFIEPKKYVHKFDYNKYRKEINKDLDSFIGFINFFDIGLFYSEKEDFQKYKKFFLKKKYRLAIQESKTKVFYAILDVNKKGDLEQIFHEKLLKKDKRKYLFFKANTGKGKYVRSVQKEKIKERYSALYVLFNSCFYNNFRYEDLGNIKFY